MSYVLAAQMAFLDLLWYTACAAGVLFLILAISALWHDRKP